MIGLEIIVLCDASFLNQFILIVYFVSLLLVVLIVSVFVWIVLVYDEVKRPCTELESGCK